MSSLTSLSWAPNTGSLHAIQATSTCAKASPSATEQSYPTLGIKIEKTGGIWPEHFLSSFSSLFKDLDHPRSTRLHVLFQSPGVGSRGLRSLNNGSVGSHRGSLLFARVHLFLVVVGQNWLRGTLGQLAQVTFIMSVVVAGQNRL